MHPLLVALLVVGGLFVLCIVLFVGIPFLWIEHEYKGHDGEIKIHGIWVKLDDLAGHGRKKGD